MHSGNIYFQSFHPPCVISLTVIPPESAVFFEQAVQLARRSLGLRYDVMEGWDLYEKMLKEFSQGTGSALEEAEKTAKSWEGRLNSLQ